MNSDTGTQQAPAFSKLLIRKSLKYGLIANLLLIVGLIIFYFLFDSVLTSAKNLSLVIAAIFMYFSVREFRSENADQMMFWQGVFIGLATFFVYAIVSGVVLFLYTKYIDPQSLNIYIEYKLVSLESYKEMIGEEKYRDYLDQTMKMNSLGVSMDHLFTLLYIGVFGSAIVSALLRKMPNAV